MTLPLSDVKIVDFTTVFAGPFGAMLLADQGAEVIKLEPPESDIPPTPNAQIGYVTFNRNKRSIVVDITKPEGREVAYDLFRWADVLLINMRVRTRERRGFTYEDVAAINPRLIYASLTAYGEEGPDADLPGYDVVVQARAGDVEGRRLLPDGPPLITLFFHFDLATSIMMAYAVTVALHDRERTGRGQKIELNLLQSGLALHTVQMTKASGSNERYGPRPAGVPYTYACSDGRYIFVIIAATRWDSYFRCLGLHQLVGDPRFDSAEKRTQNALALAEILARHFSTRPAAEWEAILKADAHGATVVKELSEVYDDPQVIANQMMIQFEQPGLGTVTATNVPFKMSGSAEQPHIRRGAPKRGEHTLEVLRELGYRQDKIEALKTAGVVG